MKTLQILLTVSILGSAGLITGCGVDVAALEKQATPTPTPTVTTAAAGAAQETGAPTKTTTPPSFTYVAALSKWVDADSNAQDGMVLATRAQILTFIDAPPAGFPASSTEVWTSTEINVAEAYGIDLATGQAYENDKMMALGAIYVPKAVVVVPTPTPTAQATVAEAATVPSPTPTTLAAKSSGSTTTTTVTASVSTAVVVATPTPTPTATPSPAYIYSGNNSVAYVDAVSNMPSGYHLASTLAEIDAGLATVTNPSVRFFWVTGGQMLDYSMSTEPDTIVYWTKGNITTAQYVYVLNK